MSMIKQLIVQYARYWYSFSIRSESFVNDVDMRIIDPGGLNKVNLLFENGFVVELGSFSSYINTVTGYRYWPYFIRKA
jgi:hypothetical protein